MTRCKLLAGIGVLIVVAETSQADIVQDWNGTLCSAAEIDVSQHNPGVPTRAMAMMNGAIYDVFQSVNRTHQPFKVDTFVPGATVNFRDAAVSQAAWEVLSSMYGTNATVLGNLNTDKANRLALIPDSPEKTAGIQHGTNIAQAYITSHQNDKWNLPDNYNAPGGVGHWTTDPMVAPTIQKGWGSDWGSVDPWAIPDKDFFDATMPFTIADLNTQRYTDAFNEVKDYGARVSVSRTDHQKATGLFWAYDRPGTGAPPVLFIENMIDIGDQIGNQPADNARMFAMASVALADAIIACWDQKYAVDLWRPITGIRGAATDGNPNTAEDLNWEYLGAPGANPGSATDDFTPPFPSYVSGHATMGGAIFKSLELFYGTNDFATADALFPGDPLTTTYKLRSTEPGSGFERDYYERFTQVAALAPGAEDSPEGENSMSRVYLGVHWRIDQEDGQALGRAVAQYVASTNFQPVPEPSTALLALLGVTAMCATIGRKRSG